MRTLTLGQARRVAVAAQRLDGPRPEPRPPTPAQVVGTVRRLGLLQIDSVNVLARAHLLPLYSRLGPYDVAHLARAAERPPRRIVETWAHEACYVPVETYPLLAWTRVRVGRAMLDAEHPGAVEEVRSVLADAGPLTTRQVEAQLDARYAARRGGWGWRWSVAKLALEHLFATGEVTAAYRTPQFERAYDLTERVLPAAVRRRPGLGPDEATRELVRIAARAHGVASVRCLADYFRLLQAPVRRAVADLVDAGELEPVRVDGWDRPAFLAAGARVPRRTSGRALLAPFDPLVFERDRVRALFGMHYRIGIYTPAERRVHGYYVLPFLLGEHLVARVDLKTDRAARVLRVRTAFGEDPVDPATWPSPAHVAAELTAELGEMARWLGLGAVVVDDDARGDLAPALRPLVR